MNEAHRKWIADQGYNNPEKAHGACYKAVADMVDHFFTELEAVRGVVRYESKGCQNGKVVEHAWCVDDDGEIADPTASQYSLVRVIAYEQVNHREPLILCPNCGERFVATDNHDTLCSDSCTVAYLAYLNGEGAF